MKGRLVTCMMMLELRGIITVYATGSASETLLTLNCHSFILTVGIIRVAIYSIEGGGYKVFDSHARDMYGNSHSEGTCVLLEIKSMHKLVQYSTLVFQKVCFLLPICLPGVICGSYVTKINAVL